MSTGEPSITCEQTLDQRLEAPKFSGGLNKGCHAAALGGASLPVREPRGSKVSLSTGASREATPSARQFANPTTAYAVLHVRGWGGYILAESWQPKPSQAR